MTEMQIGKCIPGSSMQRFADTGSKKKYVNRKAEGGDRVQQKRWASPEDGVDKLRAGSQECSPERDLYSLVQPMLFNAHQEDSEPSIAAATPITNFVEGPAADEGALNASTTNSVTSLMSRMFGTRRRRRREISALDDTRDSGEHREELEGILKSLDEMQRENKERMRNAVSHLTSTKPHLSDKNGAYGTENDLFFFRSQSLGQRSICKVRKSAALERAMTSLAMPEPSLVTPKPLPWERSKNTSHDAVSTPPRNSHMNPSGNKHVERHFQADKTSCPTTTSTSPVRAQNVNTVLSSQRKKVVDAECTHEQSVRKIPGEGRLSGGGLHPFASSNGVTEAAGDRRPLASPERNDLTKPASFGSKKLLGGRTPFARTGGRSTSPQIIILTVDARRSMGEEDARRLLSAEPVKVQEMHTRLSTHGTEGHTDARPVQSRESPERVVMESSNTKEHNVSSASLKRANPKQVPGPLQKKVGSPVSPKKGVLGTGVGVGSTTAAAVSSEATSTSGSASPGKKDDRDPTGAIETNKTLHVAVPTSKVRGVFDKRTSLKEAKEANSPMDDGGVVDVRNNTSQVRRKNGAASKPIIGVSVEQKSRSKMVPMGCSRFVESEHTHLSRATNGGTRRRTTGDEGLTHNHNLHYEDQLFKREKSIHSNLKDSLLSTHLVTGTSASLRGTRRKCLSFRPRSLSLLMKSGSLEADAHRPLATDRPSVTRPRTRKQVSEIDSLAEKQFVPFCTECGKRHIDGKVKFCAFCGHKRETV